MSDSKTLKGRVALVTGASRGIGRSVATSLADLGADVALVARTEAALRETAAEVEKRGVRSLTLPLDVSDGEAVNNAVTTVSEELGGLDILVNNAGLTRDGLVMRMSDEDWNLVLDVDLKGVFHFCRAAARPLRKSKAGRIINVSSVVGIMGNAGQVNYASAKAGILGLTKSLAKELGGRGITVNAVCPGFIETDMTKDLDAQIRERSLNSIPVGRFGQPEDIAAAVAFLCGDGAGFVTGVVLPVDGGMAMGSIG